MSPLSLSARLRWSVLWLLCVAAPASAATDTLHQGLDACAGLSDDALRLDCFDALARLSTRDEPQAPEPPAAAAGTRTYPMEGAQSPPEPAAPKPEPPAAAEPPHRADPALFGFENRSTENLDEIRSPYAGRFDGWSGRTVFTLENGQVWRQTENGKLSWSADRPMITISKGVFGSFRLSVDGVNKSVRVERVQ